MIDLWKGSKRGDSRRLRIIHDLWQVSNRDARRPITGQLINSISSVRRIFKGLEGEIARLHVLWTYPAATLAWCSSPRNDQLPIKVNTGTITATICLIVQAPLSRLSRLLWAVNSAVFLNWVLSSTRRPLVEKFTRQWTNITRLLKSNMKAAITIWAKTVEVSNLLCQGLTLDA